MNIFVVDRDPVQAAQDLCDKHVVKMIVETAQMLCSAHPAGAAPYRRTHAKHPCTLWTAASMQNYMWLIDHGIALCEEYTKRYGKRHKSQDVIEWCRDNAPPLLSLGLTPFAQAMPDQYRDPDPVTAYRNYYQGEKRRFATWKGSKPSWWKEVG